MNQRAPNRSVVIVVAIFLSLAGILLAYDFGSAFAGRLYWSCGSPVITQSIAVAVGMLLAWAGSKIRPGRFCHHRTLYWIGVVILWLPLTDTFGYGINGAHRWIGFESVPFHFPADSAGLLLILPQWVRWAANEPGDADAGKTLFGKIRLWISPSAAFTFTLIAGNLLFFRQRSFFGVYLVNSIGLVLWFLGRLENRWKIGSGAVFAVLLLLLLGVWQVGYSRHHDRTFLESLTFHRHATRYFHVKSAESSIWGTGLGPEAKYPQPTKTFHPRPSEFCEHIPDIVRLRFGLAGVLIMTVAMTGMGLALLCIARQPGSLEPSLRRAALAAYLFFPMAGSFIRTIADIWLLPAIPFPFLGYGFTVTTTAWLALGLLLREVRSERAEVNILNMTGIPQSST